MLYWCLEYSCSQGEAKSVLQMVSPNTGNISNLMLTSQYITKQLSDKPRGEERKTSLHKILLLPFSEQEIKPDSKRQWQNAGKKDEEEWRNNTHLDALANNLC